ncbi:MAG: hypothetical protein NTU49_03970, partial [Gammaproteobacteria bacterium]|nr:hypothetical protein [Gammaproteobacteria bacterium]
MLSFFAVLSAALIGAMLAPSFRQFLNAENNKEELRTKNLEEAYFLAKQISSYGACLPSHAAWLFAAITRQINMADIPKLPEDPFSKIMTLLDWHLKAPEELKVRVNELKDEIILCCEPIAKLINDLQKNDKYLAEAIERATLASKHANEISKK